LVFIALCLLLCKQYLQGKVGGSIGTPNLASLGDQVLGNSLSIDGSIHIVVEWRVSEEILGNQLLSIRGYKKSIYSQKEPYDHAKAKEDFNLLIEVYKAYHVIDDDYRSLP
jgi:hypothetical protein